jgi:hypothetical protein
MKMSIDPHSSDFINPLPLCNPIFRDQAVRSLLLKHMPTLDDIDVAMWQVGDMSQGMQIHDTDSTDGQGSTGASSSSSKGKGKTMPSGSASNADSRSPSSDVDASFEETTPLKRKRRLVRGDGGSISEDASHGQQAPSNAATGQAWGSDDSGPTTM